MAVLESESFDGLADGETIGTGNTSFDQVTGTSLDATTDAVHGTGAMDVSVASSTHTCRWTTGVGGRTVLYSRVYLEVVGGFAANDAWFMGCGDTGGSVGCFVSTTSGGNLRILQTDETGAAQNSTLALGLGDVARIEHVIDLDGETQSADIYLNANVEGIAPDETITSVATMADLADWRIGRVLNRDVSCIVDEVAIGDAPIGPVGGGATDITVDSTIHVQAAGSPILTQMHQLGVDSVAHAQVSGQPALTVDSALAVDSASHTQVAGQPSLTQVHELAPASTVHVQSAASPALGQVHVLGVADVVHLQHADKVTLTFGELVVPPWRTSRVLSDPRVSIAAGEVRVCTARAEPRVSMAR